MKGFVRLLAALASVFLIVSPKVASAQILYGSVVGSVKDSSNAAIPGATVTITNRETNRARTAVSNDVGQFTISTVPSGIYDIKITHEGFQTYTASAVEVRINSVVRVDATMQVGAVTESVNVTAESALLQTDRAEVRSEVVAKTLVNLPVVGQRNYQNLFITLPGFTPPTNAHSVPSNPSRSLTFNVNGTTRSSVNVRIDGASNTNIWLPHISAYVPALESIEMVNVVAGTFSAEQGLAGGASVNVQLKSGTNETHGSAFWYHTGNAIKATPFFVPQSKYIFNQFGGTVGGAIKKDRIFYFLSFEGTTNRQYAQRQGTVATPAMKNGDLSATPANRPIYDPLTGDPAGRNRTPFAGNILPAARISPIAKKIVSLIPNPTTSGVILANNYLGTGGYLFDRRTLDTKFNFNLTNKLTTWVRASILDYDMDNAPIFGDLGGPPISSAGGNTGVGWGKTGAATFAATYMVNPSLIVDGHFGYTVMDTNVEQNLLDENIGRDLLGIPGTNGTRRFEGGWPRFTISSFTTLGVNDAFMPYYRNDPQYQAVANATLTKGSHNVRFGFDSYRLNMNHNQPEFAGASHGAQGGFNFTGGPTQLNGGPTANEYNSWASFLLGYANNYGRLFQVPDEYTTRTSMFTFYVSDKWNVTNRLTLSLGVRYEYFPFPSRGDRGLERYDFDNNKMMVCGVGSVPKDCGVRVQRRNFAPSLGIAWRPTDKMVIRTGYGINYDPWNIARSLRTNYPVLVVLNGAAPNSFSWAGTLAEGIPNIPTPDLGNGIIDIPVQYAVTSTGDSFKRSYIQSWNFTIQRQLGKGFVGQVGYIATRQVNQLGNLDLNAGQIPGAGRAGQPYNVKFGRIVQTALVTPLFHSKYDSMQATLERRFANGFQLNLAYTFSAARGICCNDNSDGGPAISALNFYNLNRSRLSFDRPHNFSATGVWELPFGRGKRFAADGLGSKLLGGWQIGGLLSLIQGSPFTVTADGASLNLVTGSTQRADLVKPEVKKIGKIGAGQPFYDWTAFAAPTGPRFGNAGFNILRGPGIVNLDLNLFRSFDVGERFKIQFRAEAFNATNTPHFSNPSSNISSLRLNPDGSFQQGVFQVTGIANTGRDGVDERTFRLGLRIQF